MLNDVHASEHYEVFLRSVFFFASGYIYLCLIIPLTRWCVYECSETKKNKTRFDKLFMFHLNNFAYWLVAPRDFLFYSPQSPQSSIH